jgi:hypothetical protein
MWNSNIVGSGAFHVRSHPSTFLEKLQEIVKHFSVGSGESAMARAKIRYQDCLGKK